VAGGQLTRGEHLAGAVLVAPGGMVVRGWPGGVERAALAEELDSLIAAGPSGSRR